jgi:nucleoside triphosphate pyrophosphatase
MLDFGFGDSHTSPLTITETMPSHKPQIILASASPRREQLLRELGLRFRVVQPNGVEEELGGAAPEVLAMRNAQRKAHAVAGQHRDAVVIGADTVVVLDGEIIGKPRDLDDAVGMLQRLGGRQHEVITSVCLIHRALETEISFFERTRVWMRPLTAKQVRDYLHKINPLDKAGAYAIQEFGEGIVERIEGSYSNVMGLPTERVRATLEKLGMFDGTI